MIKKIFNVGQDLANTGGNAADVLDNIPSVTVDIEGEVSLRGKQGVRILINGKPSSFTSMNSADALQQLSANMIEKVEVITNPSSRYEAEGSAGIINIVLRKEKKQGWNGTFNLTGGIPHSHNAAVNINHRREKLNLFAGLGARYRWSPRTSFEHRETWDNDTLNILDQNSLHYRGGLSGNARLGADYSINKYNTLSASIQYRQGLDKNEGTIDYLSYNYLEELTALDVRDTREDEDEFSLDYNLGYEKRFARKGQKFTADIIYSSGDELESMNAIQQAFDANSIPVGSPDLRQRINNREKESELTLKADYVHPFGEEGKFEAGYRSSIRTIENKYKVEEFNYETDVWDILDNVSNDFQYDEEIHAAYAIFGNKVNKFSYQGGLRAEYTHVQTLLRTTRENNDKKYANLFPSLFLNYELNPGDALQLSYSRRLRRPRFWDLNPFFTFANPLSIRSGNPDLDPEFSHSFDLGHIKYWDKATLSSSIYYRHTDGEILRISTLEDGVNRSMPMNAASRDDLGIEFSLNYSPAKWIDFTLSSNVYKGKINGENLGFDRQTDFFSFTSRLNTKMSFAKDFDVQLMMNYRGAEDSPQGRRQGMLFTDIGLNKDILNKKATIGFRMRDIFNTQKFKYEVYGDDFYIYREGQWRARRQMYFSFSYRLNQKKRPERNRGRGDFDMDPDM